MRLARVVILGTVAACSSFGSEDESAPPDPACTADLASDPANCGACGKACAPGSACAAGMCVSGCTDKILYVSGDDGNDARDGCTPATAMRTVGAAIALATTAKLAGHEVHVCKGTYHESGLRLVHPLSIRGGYNCRTFARDDGFGKKGEFRSTNLTRIENGDYGAKPETFIVQGESVGKDTVIEGLTFAGAATGSAGGIALLVDDRASPSITDVQIVAGATSGQAATGSVGLRVTGAAAPDVKDSQIDGGTGTSASSAGSIGVFVSGASIGLRGSTISGGGGRGELGAIAVFLDGPPGPTRTVLAKNVIKWSAGTTNAAHAASTGGGIYSTASANIEINDNAIYGEQKTICRAAGSCSQFGIIASGAHRLRVVSNRIYAGDMQVTQPDAVGILLPISITETTEPIVAGNLVHAGGLTSTGAVSRLAVDLAGVRDAQVTGNTIHLGAAAGGAKVGLRVLASGGKATTGTVFSGNIVAGAAGDSLDYGIIETICDGSFLEKVDKNLFIQTPTTLERLTTPADARPCTSPVFYARPQEMETVLAGRATGNLGACPSCSIACTDSLGCMSAIFATYDAATYGAGDVFLPSGFALKKTGRCSVNRGGVPSIVPTDIRGSARTDPTSIGAAEEDDCK